MYCSLNLIDFFFSWFRKYFCFLRDDKLGEKVFFNGIYNIFILMKKIFLCLFVVRSKKLSYVFYKVLFKIEYFYLVLGNI